MRENFYIENVAVITWVCIFVKMLLTAWLKWYRLLYVTYTSNLKKGFFFPQKARNIKFLLTLASQSLLMCV